MTIHKLLSLIVLHGLSISLMGQYSGCDYESTLTGINSFPINKSTEKSLQSSVEYTINFDINYSSPDIQLSHPFQIPQSGTLDITSEGCERTCVPSDKQCIVECPNSYNTEKTQQGLPFVKYEVVLTFPDSVFTELDPNDGVIFVYDQQQDRVEFNIPEILGDFEKVNPLISPIGEIKRCMCDDNIFFYRNDNIIFEEGGIRQVNRAAGGVKEEGGIFSLNFIVDIDEVPFNNTDIIQPITLSDIGQRANYDFPQNHIVTAILDSGVNPYLLPEQTLFWDNTEACGLEDYAGYNFIDENNNVGDDRGHGTLVSLAYLKALENLSGGTAIYNSQRLLPVKVLDKCGYGTLYTTLCGMKYAQAKGADILNCSWGLETADRNMQRVVYELTEAGIHLVSSAGNKGSLLSIDNHFPSGYGQIHTYFIDEDKIDKRESLNNVWEVAGACQYIGTCGNIPDNLPLASFSNFREGENQFVEPARGAEALLPANVRPSCTIEGTSYAAPIFMAGLVENLISLPPMSDILKDDHWGSSFPNIHPEYQRRSYFIRKCTP